MKKVLDINGSPFLHGYSHTASFMSITMNRVRFGQSDVNVSDLIWGYDNSRIKTFFCEIVNGYEKRIIKNLPPNVKIKNDSFDIFFNGNNDESIYLFNALDSLQSFEYKLNAMKEICRWSMAGAEINNGNSNNGNFFRAVFAPMNMIYITGEKNGDKFTYNINNKEKCQYMKLDTSDVINVLISENGEDWHLIHREDNYFDRNLGRVGFFSWIGCDSFEDWFFSNFIQLHCSKNLECYYDVKLNYYIAPFLKSHYNMSNPWIDEYYIPKEYVEQSKGILDFIHFCLNKDIYVSLHLNEKYIPDKWAYNYKDFEHESLIYGLDDEKEILYLMGFNKTQTFEPYTLSYSIFLSSYNNVFYSKELIMMTFTIPDLSFTLNPTRIINFLKEYSLGINSTFRETLIYDKIDWVFGINVYDVMIDHVNLLRDKKIVYLLSEHKKFMKERIN